MSSAAFAYPNKSAEAFRTISEVAVELDVPQHVLRFWESRFVQIKPVKRAGGRRYYRPEDIDLLKGIRALLYSDGLTIRGVQKVLKERGLRHVVELGRGDGRSAEPARVQVIEKIVYVEKPAPTPGPNKARAPHLRPIAHTMDLPFFEEQPLSREFPVLDSAPPRLAEPVIGTTPERVPEALSEPAHGPMTEASSHEASDAGLAVEDAERLEELLDELKGLKARLQAARERF